MSGDDEIVQAFLEESRENLDQLDRDLVDLEFRPSDPALLGRVFRTIHTIKGTCGFLGFHRLEALTHAGEDLLGQLRSGELSLDGPITTSLLALVDATRTVLRQVEATGAEGDADHGDVIAGLTRHLATDRPPDPPDTGAPIPPPAREAALDAPETTGPSAEQSVRVDVSVLDKLLDLVGELLLTRSQIGEIAQQDDDGPLAVPYRQLRLVTAELQDGVMRARLQPVGTVTGKFRRIVRDLAAALGKQVRLELEGEEVGVDKAVNEALRDPLLHLVRNAVDHGVEAPAERLAAGKPAEAVLHIRAYHEGGRVHVVVSDDGRGIDGDRLAERAVTRGDLSAGEAAELAPAQRLELMFRPGLSTKAEVSSLSGRGVGMDVVRTNLESVGGTIEVSSEPGRGSVFRLNVPLTLAIMPALVVWCGGGRYAVPQVDIEEIVHVDADAEEDPASVHDVDGVRLYRLRGRLLPLVDLGRLLGLQPVGTQPGLDVVVVRSGGRRFGLLVDDVGDTIEAVVKPLPRAVRSVPVFSGVTILGDGEAALILDVTGVAAGSGIDIAAGDQGGVGTDGSACSSSSGLLLASGADGLLAFPLEVVQRLERFAADRVEHTGGAEVVQYGAAILPLIRIAGSDRSEGVLETVVCTSSAGPVALVVDRIEDVLADHPAQQPLVPDGVPASLVVEGRVTELVDVESLVAAAGLASRT